MHLLCSILIFTWHTFFVFGFSKTKSGTLAGPENLVQIGTAFSAGISFFLFFLLQRVFVNRLTLFLSQLDCSVCAFFPSNLREGNRLSAEGSNVTGCGKRVRRRPSNGCTHWRLVSARDREECRDASARPFGVAVASVAGGSAAEADTCHTSCR